MLGVNGSRNAGRCGSPWWNEPRGNRGGREEAVLELVLATGERLRIGAGVDSGTLRAVLDILRS